MSVSDYVAKAEGWVKSLDWKDTLKKSVTVPLKMLVIGGVAIFVLAFALSLAHRAQPKIDAAMGVPNIPNDIEVLASIEDLKQKLDAASVCKFPAPKAQVSKNGKK